MIVWCAGGKVRMLKNCPLSFQAQKSCSSHHHHHLLCSSSQGFRPRNSSSPRTANPFKSPSSPRIAPPLPLTLKQTLAPPLPLALKQTLKPTFKQTTHTRTTHSHTRPGSLLVLSGDPSSAFTSLANDVVRAGHTYSDLLVSKPLPVKSVTSGLIYGVGDVLAQLPPWRESTKGKSLDGKRLRNFMALGVGVGFIWALYYDWLEAQIGYLELPEGALRLSVEVACTQLLWTPLFFFFYTLPVNAYLNGKRDSEIIETVKEAWGPLVISNWKVWPFADLVIFNLPVQWRVLTANIFDIIWATIESDQVTDIKEDVPSALDVDREQKTSLMPEDNMEENGTGEKEKPITKTTN